MARSFWIHSVVIRTNATARGTAQRLARFGRPASGHCRGAPHRGRRRGTTPAEACIMRRTALLLLALASVFPHPASAAKPKLCTQTARAARHACANGARDDFWTAIGLCTNTSEPASRDACRRTAKSDGHDAAQSCGEQFHAREKLCATTGQSAYAPPIDPGRFLSPTAIAARPNPLFPLVPGTVWDYANGTETNTVTVTGRTKQILGVTCIVAQDTVSVAGQVTEDTEDYFTQDVDGNVWYFGELSKTFENGDLTSLEGSWRAGVSNASPGMIMPAAPTVGTTYRQEFALGTAEDAAEVLSVTGSATVPATSCAGTCLVTREFSPLEPNADEQKYYAPGIGMILEVESDTGIRNELVRFTRG